jgi:diacylglycerol kinase family enzyme
MKSKNRKALSTCLFVLNSMRYPRKARRLARLLKAAGAPPPFEAGSAAEFREAVRSFPGSAAPYLIVFGGDGTVSEALNVLFEREGSAELLRGKALGFIRGGSGNGYHDSYGVPVSLRRQIAAIEESAERNLTLDVDLLKADLGGRALFGQLVGLGFDARVLARRAGRPRVKPRQGLLGYVLAFIGAFAALGRPIAAAQHPLTLSMQEAGVASDGDRGDPVFPAAPLTSLAPLIEIGKRPFYGNRFKVCPGAVPDDGRMDVVLFNFESKLSVLVRLIPLWMGWHRMLNRRLPLVEHFSAERVLIASDEPLALHVDGELPPPDFVVRSLSVSVIPRAVSFLVPRRLGGAVSRAGSNHRIQTS